MNEAYPEMCQHDYLYHEFLVSYKKMDGVERVLEKTKALESLLKEEERELRGCC